MAVLLDNPVRSYAWGSTTVIPQLLGLKPSGEPQAELWVGAHSGSPSVVVGDGRTLGQVIAADPEKTLGRAVAARFGPSLPYLLKILAIERPLSIQAHPTIEQAVEGYAAEDAAGIPLDSPKRSYRDRNHKPEMVVALTDFEALVGFREPAEIAELLAGTGRPEFIDAAAMLQGDDGLRAVVHHWLNLPEDRVVPLVSALTEVARARQEHEPFAVVAQLADAYPGDRGLLLAVLMLLVRLRPGDAVFVGSGVPHAYLSGVAVEPQASSDNTLRAGLTPKHVDAAQVERILRYEPHGGQIVRPRETGPDEHLYPVDGVEEFRLYRLRLGDEPLRPGGVGPRVVLVVEGHAQIRVSDGQAGAGDVIELRQGHAAFVPATEPWIALTGDGVAFTITPNVVA